MCACVCANRPSQEQKTKSRQEREEGGKAQDKKGERGEGAQLYIACLIPRSRQSKCGTFIITVRTSQDCIPQNLGNHSFHSSVASYKRPA